MNRKDVENVIGKSRFFLSGVVCVQINCKSSYRSLRGIFLLIYFVRSVFIYFYNLFGGRLNSQHCFYSSSTAFISWPFLSVSFHENHICDVNIKSVAALVFNVFLRKEKSQSPTVFVCFDRHRRLNRHKVRNPLWVLKVVQCIIHIFCIIQTLFVHKLYFVCLVLFFHKPCKEAKPFLKVLR